MIDLDEIEKIPFVFIVGRGRSGTTLLQNVLDANENVILPIESRLIIHLKQKYFRITHWNSILVDELIQDLYKDKKFNTFWGINKVELTKKIKTYPIEKLSFATICKIIYLSYPSPFDKEKINLIGDKNPIYSIFIEDLLEIFPDAKFIQIIRDYRDNVVSNRASFTRKATAALGNGWLAFNLGIEKIKKNKPNYFYTIRYIDLVTSPKQKTKEICTFLGIDYNQEMLNFHEKISSIKKENDFEALDSIHKNLVNPINTKQINKWKKSLSTQDVELLDLICGDYAKTYDYFPTTNKSSLLLRYRSFLGNVRYKIDFWVIKTYYKSPFFLRDFTGFISKKIFDWFKLSTYYNHADFLFEKDNQT